MLFLSVAFEAFYQSSASPHLHYEPAPESVGFDNAPKC